MKMIGTTKLDGENQDRNVMPVSKLANALRVGLARRLFAHHQPDPLSAADTTQITHYFLK
jgi:hypothetical protein